MTCTPSDETTRFALQVEHTSRLPAGTLAEARALMDAAFPGDFAEDDWEHALGGMHVLAWADQALVGHASVVQRRLFHAGRAWRVGYVEAVAVHPRWQRRGLGGRLMEEVGRVVRGGYQMGALGSTDEARPLYERHGWLPWRGTLWCMGPQGLVRTADEEGSMLVLPVEGALDLDGPLTCDFRDGDVW
jgi:aminoglycoside 2'-N-acetyltransferase I